MKKIVLATLLATGLMAADNANYFGINVGNAKLKVDASGSGINDSATIDGTQYTAVLGHYYGDTGRISAAYTYIKHDAGVDNSDAFSVAYDFILPVVENRFSLYAGPVVGYTEYKESNLDLSGFHYGAQAGAIVRVIDKIELEAGYRYLEETGKDTFGGATIKANNVQMWYVGANIRF